MNDVYETRDELEAKAVEMAEEIAANPPLAVQGAKDVFLFDDEAGLKRSLHYNAARSSMILPSEDLFEAMGAYAQNEKATSREREIREAGFSEPTYLFPSGRPSNSVFASAEVTSEVPKRSVLTLFQFLKKSFHLF